MEVANRLEPFTERNTKATPCTCRRRQALLDAGQAKGLFIIFEAMRSCIPRAAK
ncbi:MAG: hypothetical protein ACLTD2_02010 [Ruminococcus sp.]